MKTRSTPTQKTVVLSLLFIITVLFSLIIQI